MSLPLSRAALRRLAGWALPVLAGLLVAPAAARADCGDYVVTRIYRDAMAGRHEPVPPDAPRPHKPCSGPLCSQAPVAPTAPVPTAPRPASQEWGCFLNGLFLAPLDRGALLADEQPQSPVRLASAIFHPPRLAS